jgi:hypothetical protein
VQSLANVGACRQSPHDPPGGPTRRGPRGSQRRPAEDCSPRLRSEKSVATLERVRTLLVTLAVLSLVGFGAASAAAQPSRTAKLTPAEAKWVAPVVTLWNTMNAGLLMVVSQASAKDALIVGTKNNGKLNTTLATFITCGKTLKKPGAAPPRLTKFAGSMKGACSHLAAGGHSFAKAISAIYKRNSTLGQKLLVQGVGQFKLGSNKLATARKQLLAVGGKNIFG